MSIDIKTILERVEIFLKQLKKGRDYLWTYQNFVGYFAEEKGRSTFGASIGH